MNFVSLECKQTIFKYDGNLWCQSHDPLLVRHVVSVLGMSRSF